MTLRRPLVRIAGRTVQLPATDTLPGAGSSGWTAVDVTVTPAYFGHADIIVTDATVTPANRIVAMLEPSADWEAGDLAGFEVLGTAGTGQITFTISESGPIVGAFSIVYSVI